MQANPTYLSNSLLLVDWETTLIRNPH